METATMFICLEVTKKTEGKNQISSNLFLKLKEINAYPEI